MKYMHLLRAEDRVIACGESDLIISKGHGCTKWPQHVTCPKCLEIMKIKIG